MTDERFDHAPVLLDRVLELLGVVADGTFVDLTVGGGGHAGALLDVRPGLRLLGLDRDPSAVDAARRNLSRFGERVHIEHARSDDLVGVLAARGIDNVTAVLADLGVSSPQVDRAERGFSYRDDRSGPVDMRMDPTTGPTAADIVNEADETEIRRMLRDLADERHATRIAAAIVAHRPITSTADLADVVRAAVPAPARRRGGDPAKRTFQALRIAVNDELDVLARTLDQALDVVTLGGRVAVISYHSGEDRIVKRRFRTAVDGGCVCPPGLPCVCGAVATARPLGRRAIVASPAERARNPRAASARLRAVEKIEPTPVGGL
ncbi:MAG: 16S rRNA (cytosine(1402)-N(4))-methyltransferase RsmH [Acidimicrobiia bacterium]|nr:16S rRNA (cytosine(1402)-N(4))-methyltransferase RsmH [Acidimicrobiia bacterium]